MTSLSICIFYKKIIPKPTNHKIFLALWYMKNYVSGWHAPRTVVGGPHVPQDCGPWTSCSPGSMVLGPNVPVKTGCLPITKYQHHLSSDGKLDVEPENTAAIIHQNFLKHSHTEDGMQPCCASTNVKLKFNQLINSSCTVWPYQFDLLIHEYGDSIFSKKDL